MFKITTDDIESQAPELTQSLDELVREGARRMIVAALGDFSQALRALLGPEAAGFSATTITRLLTTWQDDYQAWRKRSLEGKCHRPDCLKAGWPD